jgi:hypothetical protein
MNRKYLFVIVVVVTFSRCRGISDGEVKIHYL